MPTLDVDGTTLRYEAHGSGPPLVLLHGAWLDRALWAPQVGRFADDWLVVTPDLRGHGGSPAGGPFGVDRLAADLAALCDRLDGRPVVCGLSLGSLVAGAFAAADPARPAGLVLASAITSVPPVALPEAARRVLFPRAPAHAAVRTWGPGAYFRALLCGVEAVEGPWLALDGDARRYALDRIDGYDADGFLRVLDALYEFAPRDLSGLDVPTLLVHGDREAAPVVVQNRRLERTLPAAERTAVPDAGHLVNRDNPAAFDAALAAFLDARIRTAA